MWYVFKIIRDDESVRVVLVNTITLQRRTVPMSEVQEYVREGKLIGGCSTFEGGHVRVREVTLTELIEKWCGRALALGVDLRPCFNIVGSGADSRVRLAHVTAILGTSWLGVLGMEFDIPRCVSIIWHDCFAGLGSTISRVKALGVVEIGDFAFANAQLSCLEVTPYLQTIGQQPLYESAIKDIIIRGDDFGGRDQLRMQDMVKDSSIQASVQVISERDSRYALPL